MHRMRVTLCKRLRGGIAGSSFTMALLLSGMALAAESGNNPDVRQEVRLTPLTGNDAVPSKEQLMAAIQAACPEKPRVQPAKPRKLLVVVGCPIDESLKNMPFPGHQTVMPLKLLADKSKAFEAVFTTDLSVLNKEKLAEFDAVCLDNWHELPSELIRKKQKDVDAKKKAEETMLLLHEYIQSGKGLVGFHTTLIGLEERVKNENGRKVFEDQALLGWHGYRGHPILCGNFQSDEPSHPLCAALDGKTFFVEREEFYQFPFFEEEVKPQQIAVRAHVRVLVSADVPRCGYKNSHLELYNHDAPLAWIHQYGKGRAFYSALSHARASYCHPAFMQFLLDGIQYAMGDLNADATPSAELMKTRMAELAKTTAALPPEQAAAELCKVISTDHSWIGRYAAGQLLAKLPAPAAAAALKAAVPGADAAGRAELAYCLGSVRKEAGDEILLKLVDDPDAGVRVESMRALMAGPEKDFSRLQSWLNKFRGKKDRYLEQKIVLQFLGQVPTMEALKFVEGFIDDTVKAGGYPVKGPVGESNAYDEDYAVRLAAGIAAYEIGAVTIKKEKEPTIAVLKKISGLGPAEWQISRSRKLVDFSDK